MRGTKRKIAMEKIQKKDSRSVAFSKRRNGLYSKASELCQLSGAQIAILVTPISSNSNVTFYSYGHSSVDAVVSAFLADERPPKEDLGSRYWWEDESLIEKLDDPTELSEAVDSILRMMQNLKGMCPDLGNHEGVNKKNQKKKGRTQTLIQQSTSTSRCTQELSDSPANFESFVENREEENQIVPVSENLDACNQSSDFDKFIDFVMNSEGMCMNFEVDEISTNQNHFSDSKVVEDEALLMHRDSDADQITPITDNKNNNNDSPGDLNVCNQDLDVDQFIDFEMDEVSMNHNMCSDSNVVEDEALLVYRDSDADQITPITDNNNNNSLPGNLDLDTNTLSFLMSLEMEDDSMMKMSQDLFFDFKAVEDNLQLYDVFKSIAPL